jgi:hypothetical protein
VDNACDGFYGVRNVLILSAVTRGNALLAALVLSAVAACSDPQAGTLPSVSPTATTPTATPSPSVSVDLAQSLRDALQTYFDALYAAGMDPARKTDALAALIAPSCPCYRVVGVLREEARLGRHIDYTYALRQVQVVEATPKGGDIRYTVMRSAGAERDKSGRVIERYKATTEKYSAHFSRAQGAWSLAGLTRFS